MGALRTKGKDKDLKIWLKQEIRADLTVFSKNKLTFLEYIFGLLEITFDLTVHARYFHIIWKKTYQTVLIFWGYGEIGKHAGFKIQCRKASRFKSEYSHHSVISTKTKKKPS